MTPCFTIHHGIVLLNKSLQLPGYMTCNVTTFGTHRSGWPRSLSKSTIVSIGSNAGKILIILQITINFHTRMSFTTSLPWWTGPQHGRLLLIMSLAISQSWINQQACQLDRVVSKTNFQRPRVQIEVCSIYERAHISLHLSDFLFMLNKVTCSDW